MHTPITPDAEPATPDGELADTSRRSLIRQLVGVAAGVTVAAVALDSGEASAQTGAMQYGLANNAGIDSTSLLASVAGGRTLSTTNFGANGFAYGGEATTVYGGYGSSYGMNMTAGDTGIIVFGQQQGVHAQAQYGAGLRAESTEWIGATFQGGKADLFLAGSQAAPIARTDAHIAGEITRDSDTNMWACVGNGLPGTWRKLAGPATAGSLHVLEPTRVYDSRWATGGGGVLATGLNRGIDVSAGRNLSTGVVEMPGLVPPKATALQYTITITGTSGSGFVAVTSIGAVGFKASSINWSENGQTMANSTLGKLTSPELRLWAGGNGSTHVIIDVLGYYL